MNQTNSSKTIPQSMVLIEKSLMKLGFSEDQITIKKNSEQNWATVEWRDNKTKWIFKCSSQKDIRTNVAALALFVEGRVRNIQRGIENKEELNNLLTQLLF